MAAEDLPAGAEVFCGWAPAASIFEAFHKRVCACCLAWGRGRAGPRIYCSAEVELAHFSRSQSPSLRQTQVLWVASPPPPNTGTETAGFEDADGCGPAEYGYTYLYLQVVLCILYLQVINPNIHSPFQQTHAIQVSIRLGGFHPFSL